MLFRSIPVRTNLIKKTLAALLAAAMAGSMLVTSAFAADGDVKGTWDGATIKSKGSNEQHAYELVDGEAVRIPGNIMGTLGQPIWGCETGVIDMTKTYTIVYTMKLEDDESVDGAITFMATDPKVRIKKTASGDMVSDTNDHRVWYTLEKLRKKQAKAGDDGYFKVYHVLTAEGHGYADLIQDGNGIAIENRLAGPSAYDANLDPAEAAENRVTSDCQNINLLVKSIEVIEGDVTPADEANGWSNGKYYNDGVMATNALVPSITGTGYSYVNETGDAVVSQAVEVNGATYYFDEKAISVSNKFITIGGKQLYFGSDYKLATKAQVVTVNGVKYAVKANGEMLVNGWYNNQYFGANGKIVKGQFTGDYAVDAQGKMIKNQVAKIGGKYYAFGADGKLIKTGKLATVAGKKTIADKNGVVKVNAKVGSYVVGANGYCVKSAVKKIGKKTYAIGANYKVVTGTKVVKIGKKSYAVVKGAVKTAKGNQIVKIGKKKYAANKNGQILINKKKVKVGKKTYKTDKKGVAKLAK